MDSTAVCVEADKNPERATCEEINAARQASYQLLRQPCAGCWGAMTRKEKALWLSNYVGSPVRVTTVVDGGAAARVQIQRLTRTVRLLLQEVADAAED